MQTIRQDLRYGLRGFRKQPLVRGARRVTLALGIGSATTIFSVIQNVLSGSRGDTPQRPDDRAALRTETAQPVRTAKALARGSQQV